MVGDFWTWTFCVSSLEQRSAAARGARVRDSAASERHVLGYMMLDLQD